MKNQVFAIALKWSAAAYILGWVISFATRSWIHQPSEYSLGTVRAIFTITDIALMLTMAVLALRELEQKAASEMSAGKAFSLMMYMFLMLAIAGLITMTAQYLFFLRKQAGWQGWSLTSMLIGWGAHLLQQALYLLVAVGMYGIWRVFTRAGKPGWASLVPFYNQVVQCEIGRKPVWWVAMLFIPLVNIVVSIMITHGVSKAFGKDENFTVGLVLLPFIFYPILGFGKDHYLDGPEQTGASSAQ